METKQRKNKHKIRLDYHTANNATPPFIGIFLTTQNAMEKGAPTQKGDIVQVRLYPSDKVVSDLLEDAIVFACNEANKVTHKNSGDAVSFAAKALRSNGKTANPAVAKLEQMLIEAATVQRNSQSNR